MTQKEKIEVRDLRDKLDVLDENGRERNQQLLQLSFKIDKILDILQDDPNSSSTGLISKVNQHEDALKNIKSQSKAMSFIISISAAVITFVVNTYSKIS